MSATPQPLPPLAFPLWGSRLIEASAGTGKTWTIAALYVRLVLGHGDANAFVRPLRPAEILVMTFTRAATRELSDRIRTRLLEAAQCFRGEEKGAPDPFLAELLAAYPEGAARMAAAWRLAMAAETMDDAAIHTIDAWCQRMLREHAFDSGCLFDEELAADEKSLQTEAAKDYWRQQCYPLQGGALEAVLGVWGHVDVLVADMRQMASHTLPPGCGQGSLAERIAQHHSVRASAMDALKAGWAERTQAMRDWLDAETAPAQCDWLRTKLKPSHYAKWLEQVAAWARSPDAEPLVLTAAARQRLSPAGLQDARKDGAAPITVPADFQALADLLTEQAALPDLGVVVRLHAAARVQARMAHLKAQRGQFGFQDMLVRLDRALAGANGPALRERMVTQAPVALIDEFQDTSALQYRIFDQLYRTADNDPETALLLIGDPKQSIYGFRGADIASYLAARRATAGRHYVLGTNHRSTQALVDVLNHGFSRAEARDGEGAFRFRNAATGESPLPFVPVLAQGRGEHLHTSEGPVPALALHHCLELRSAEEHRRLFAALCAERIATWLQDGQAGFVQAGGDRQRLRPADIAVLVRTGTEAAAVRRELRLRGVASVYLSDQDSVFASDEARDLWYWLQAVAAPRDAGLLRAALATRTVGLSLAELEQLADDEEVLDARGEQVRSLHGAWQSLGVLAMLRQSLHVLDLPARWLAEPGGERRLTNYLHLAELLQEASAQLEGEQALVRWLGEQMQEGAAMADDQIVRLESDADLVQVITVHKSKGLEYPVVCLPFASSFRSDARKAHAALSLAGDPDDPGASGSPDRQLHLQPDDAAWDRATLDRQREDLRLLYVALTRARHALWLGFAATRVGNAAQCQTHLSAAGYWIAGAEPRDAAAWLAPLQALAQDQPGIAFHAVEYDSASAVPRTLLAPQQPPTPLQPPLVYQGDFDRHWVIGSFSQMVRGAAMVPASYLPRAVEDESALPHATGAALEQAVPVAPAATVGWHGFPRGALAGNFLHEQLEWWANEGFAEQRPGEAEGGVLLRLRQRCQRAGWGAHADAVAEWVQAVTSTPLPGVGVPLRELDTVLAEMEFWLPATHLDAKRVDALCGAHLLAGRPRAPLPERTLHGMLMGFADLVFEQAGRYWVLDYKSNHLGADGSAYTRDAMEAAMALHRYDVQAAVYQLALHRLLRQRMGEDYSPQEHLGGALYLFLRGIDGPERGVYTVLPSLPLLHALDALIDGKGAPA